jgi:hypothetical protein
MPTEGYEAPTVTVLGTVSELTPVEPPTYYDFPGPRPGLPRPPGRRANPANKLLFHRKHPDNR